MRFFLLPLAALVAVLPFVLGGHSCGLDFAFHMQSWLGAADQLRHGVLFPRWNFFSAWNAGEPRFIFYPPLSWMLGAFFTLLLPFNAVPTVLTWLILTIAGFSMYRLARAYVSEPIALIVSCFFLANPFMLWTITGRNAYAELLCAAFCPLLIAAMLAPRPSPWAIGLALALMWLSNVPGGVLGTYLLFFLALVRLGRAFLQTSPSFPVAQRVRAVFPLSMVITGGFLYGLALAAFFLVPANVERRFIHMEHAFTPNYRPTDNLFFHRVVHDGRDFFFIRTEKIAIAMAVATALALALAWLISRHRRGDKAWREAGTPMIALFLALAFGMTFLAAPLWRLLPALWVVQFPWRALFILGACLALSLALALRRMPIRVAPAALAGLGLSAALAFIMVPATRLLCPARPMPDEFLERLHARHAPDPTDEYVVATGNADFLRPDNPPFWLATSPAAYAPGTTPNPAATDPNGSWPSPPDNALLFPTPLRFSVNAPASAFLVVNLQDYPNWRIARGNGPPLQHLKRTDGLLTVALPAGGSTLSISWHHSWDEYAGFAITLVAISAFALSRKRTRALLFTRRA